jgi:SpoIID/LytB domain protein
VTRACAIALALVVGFGVQGSGFWVGSGFAEPRTQNREPRTQNPEPSTLNPEPRTNPEPGTQNPEPRTNPEPSTLNPEPSPAALRVGFARAGGGFAVTSLPIERYVARVLAGEALRGSRPAALEALAITIRTFALANLGRHRADGFDMCDQTHCQVVRSADAETERAAQATAGRLLLWRGSPASVFYTASCGGRTEMPSHVWPGAEDPPFLPSQGDDACDGAPAWTAAIEERDLLRALRAAGFSGERLRRMRVESRNASGRVASLALEGLRPDRISGQDLRVAVGRTLGWPHIKSTAFELRREDEAYRFSGHGFGHGVGLCVIGSARLAERGVGAEAILARYFPGASVTAGNLSPTEVRHRSDPSPRARGVGPSSDPGLSPGVLLTLPDGDEGQRDAILQQALRARDELARTLGVSPPAAVTLRFHPTTDEYERATGQPWFTSATAVRGELHLLPLAVLRDRGVLERTIRHELVHIMTDAVLAARAQWVREGAAIYFAGEQPIAGHPQQRPPFTASPRASCPADHELRQPVSVGALSNAYARGRACFARQLAAGRSWRDVR